MQETSMVILSGSAFAGVLVFIAFGIPIMLGGAPEIQNAATGLAVQQVTTDVDKIEDSVLRNTLTAALEAVERNDYETAIKQLNAFEKYLIEKNMTEERELYAEAYDAAIQGDLLKAKEKGEDLLAMLN